MLCLTYQGVWPSFLTLTASIRFYFYLTVLHDVIFAPLSLKREAPATFFLACDACSLKLSLRDNEEFTSDERQQGGTSSSESDVLSLLGKLRHNMQSMGDRVASLESGLPQSGHTA